MNDLEATKVLASGIDTLDLSIEVDWKKREFFDRLREEKERAKSLNKNVAGILKGDTEDDKWLYGMRPFGGNGYEWILEGNEFKLVIGNWMESKAMPGVKINIGSETLWREGPLKITERIMSLIRKNNGIIRSVKVSRGDLCLDIMLDTSIWNGLIDEYMVTKGNQWNLWKHRMGLKSLYVGNGDIKARLYDKPLQIKQMLKKYWMYNVWGINENEIKEEQRVIRVEFQIRRKVIKELGAGSLNEFFSKCDQVWSYCTRKWLKFRTRPGKHTIQRKTFEWWEKVQEGFYGVQGACPAIRKKAIREDEDKLTSQMIGFATSLTALKMEEYEFDYEEDPNFNDCINSALEALKRKGLDEDDFKRIVREKRVKYSRSRN